MQSSCSGIPIKCCGKQKGHIFMVEVTGGVLDGGVCKGWFLA